MKRTYLNKVSKIVLSVVAILGMMMLTACGEEPFTYTNEQAVALWDEEAEIPYYKESMDQDTPSIIPYVAEENEDGKCVIICPGGGYEHYASETEGTEIAAALNAEGISAFILQYRLAPYTGEAYMSDLFRAVRFVRYYAEEFGVDPDKIIVMGFSAGGHLALMGMQHFQDDLEVYGDKIDEVSARPNAGVLGYAVISLEDELTHEKTRLNFLGEGNETDETLIKKYSGEKNVTADMPPVFLWHTEKDAAVPCDNSILLAEALENADVEYKLLTYRYGNHGAGLAANLDGTKEWFGECLTWLEDIFAE